MENTDSAYLIENGIHSALESVLGNLLKEKPEEGLRVLTEKMLEHSIAHGAFKEKGSLSEILKSFSVVSKQRGLHCDEVTEIKNLGGLQAESDCSLNSSGRRFRTASQAMLAQSNRMSISGPPQFRTLKRLLRSGTLITDGDHEPGNKGKLTLSAVLSTKSEAASVLLQTCLDMSSNQTDHQKLVETLIQSASKLLEADRCTFFLVEGEEIVSKIAEGTSEIRLPIGGGIAGNVAKTGKVINLPDAYADSRFNQDIDKKTGYRTKALLCAPVLYESSVIAVAQLLNKKNAPGKDYFCSEDESLFQAFSLFAGVFLQNSYTYRQIATEKRKNEILLDVVQRVSETDLGSWLGVCDVIVDGCTALLQAERCTLFIIDKENGTLLANSGGTEIRMPLDHGIAGFVCQSGETVNIPDAYCDPRFNPDVDAATGFVTRTILCMPVIAQGETVAVAQVINKISGEFTDDDEELLRFFAAFGGLHLANSKLMEFCQESRDSAMRLLQASSGVADSTEADRIYPATDEETAAAMVYVSDEEYQMVLSDEFNVHTYVHKQESYMKLIPLSVFLFEHMGILDEFKVSKTKLAKFLVTTSKKYRAIPYHNFVHAFDVLQTMYLYIEVYGCKKVLHRLDIFVLFVSALLHDVDHMGLNNSFHSKSETPLGLLSNASGASSVLEVHHCNVAIAILGFPELSLFSELQKEQSVFAYKLLINNILNTDMARHRDAVAAYSELKVMNRPPDDEDQRKLLCSILLKCADLSNLTKPFNISRLWGIAITTEFYLQGDSERAAGKSVTPGFDRTTKQELAQGQIGFIRGVALSFYTAVANGSFSGLEPVLLQLQSNLSKWEAVGTH